MEVSRREPGRERTSTVRSICRWSTSSPETSFEKRRFGVEGDIGATRLYVGFAGGEVEGEPSLHRLPAEQPVDDCLVGRAEGGDEHIRLQMRTQDRGSIEIDHEDRRACGQLC